jgi:hypothetical protein
MCQDIPIHLELAVQTLMRFQRRLSGMGRIGSHHFLRSLHNSWQPDREGRSAAGFALDRDVPPIIWQNRRLMARPRPVPPYLLAVEEEAWENS